MHRGPGKTAGRMLILLWLCGSALCGYAADPSYSSQLDFLLPTAPPVNETPKAPAEVAAFEQAFSNHVHAMAQGPQIQEDEPVPNTSVAWACVGAAALALGIRFLGPRAVLRFTKEGQALVSLALHPETLRAEEKSFADFATSFKVGKGRSAPKDPADEETEAAQKILEESATLVGKLRKIFGKLGPTAEAARQVAVLAELCQELHDFKSALNVPKLLPIWNLTLALEGLLKQFQLRSADMTPSALRTAAVALDTLDWLVTQRVTNNVFGSPPVKLLVVDDDPISLRAVSHSLKQSFDAPDVAANGEAGLALVKENPYDVIFLDVEMPGIDGFELCSEIRQSERNRETPVVFVTSKSDFNSRVKAPLKGAQDLIAKPFLKFEITVKALTLILQYRLRIGPQHPAIRAALQQLAAKPADAAKKETAVPPSKSGAPVASPIPSTKSAPAAHLTPSAAKELKATPEKTSAAAPAAATTGSATTPPASKKEDKPVSGDATATKLEAFNFDALNKQLEAIGCAESPRIRQSLLADIRVSLRQAGEQAARTGRGAAYKLCCLAETLLTKVIEDPQRLQRSTLGAIAATVEVLEQLFATRQELKLDEPPTIMIADDDPLTRRALSGALQLALGKPTAVEDGESALALARKTSFDIIFMDVRMPGMGGFEAALRIREAGCNRRTQVVFVTSRSDDQFREQASRAGASAFITKPFVVSEITLTALAFTLRNRLGQASCAESAEPAMA